MGEQVDCQTPPEAVRGSTPPEGALVCCARPLTGNGYESTIVTMAKKTIRSSVVDTANITKEYWEKVLRDAGLSMHAGIHEFREPKQEGEKLGKLRRRDVPVGNSTDLEILHKMLQIEDLGQVSPEGYGPDDPFEK